MTDHDPTAPKEVPCTIHTQDGQSFVVADVGAWQYQDFGIFATGRWTHWSSWAGETVCSAEQDVLIPYPEVKYLEFDFAALERYHAAQLIESVQAEEPEDEAA